MHESIETTMALTQDEIRALLEERNEKGELKHQDVLTPAVLRESAFFKSCVCPSCGAAARAILDVKRPFVPGNPLPNKLLQCVQCQTEFNPYTGLITKAPTVGSD